MKSQTVKITVEGDNDFEVCVKLLYHHFSLILRILFIPLYTLNEWGELKSDKKIGRITSSVTEGAISLGIFVFWLSVYYIVLLAIGWFYWSSVFIFFLKGIAGAILLGAGIGFIYGLYKESGSFSSR